MINDMGFLAIIVTNQSGIARGLLTNEKFLKIQKTLLERLAKKGARIDGYYYCPHHPQGRIEKYRKKCDCRKPGPGMFQQAIKDFDIDVTRSFAVGDKMRDIAPIKNMGGQGILVTTGQGKAELKNWENWAVRPDAIEKCLYNAVEWTKAMKS